MSKNQIDRGISTSHSSAFRIAVALVVTLMSAIGTEANAQDVTVFAAVSLTNALTDIAKIYNLKNPVKIRLSFNATSTLAKQIEAGAPADIFISADEQWMDYLETRNLIDKSTRSSAFGNSLALVTKADDARQLKIVPNLPLAAYLNGGRLAIGDPDHTAVGIYAKQALLNLGVWDSVASSLARAASVRAGLTMVERGEVSMGIAFTTEAKLSDKVRILDIFPAKTHEAIVYPVALVSSSTNADQGKAFIAFLSGSETRRILDGYGFVMIESGN
jgi:molybdate transport system substrate-binding protein